MCEGDVLLIFEVDSEIPTDDQGSMQLHEN